MANELYLYGDCEYLRLFMLRECFSNLRVLYNRNNHLINKILILRSIKIINTLNSINGIMYFSSTPSLCSVSKNEGNITINTNRVTNGVVKCIIVCSHENYTNSNEYYLYQVAEYKPTIDILLTSFPFIIYPNEEFNATLVLSYPIIICLTDKDKKDVTMKNIIK